MYSNNRISGSATNLTTHNRISSSTTDLQTNQIPLTEILTVYNYPITETIYYNQLFFPPPNHLTEFLTLS